MLVKILGGIDLIAGLILIFGTNIKLPSFLLIFFGIILMIKSLFGLLRDFVSWVDFLSGITFVLLIFFHMPLIICLVFGILLIQKGFFSFL